MEVLLKESFAERKRVGRVNEKTRRARWLMGTFVEIEAIGETATCALEAVEEAFLEMKRIERLFSKFLFDSPVSQANRFGHERPVAVPEEVAALSLEALEFSLATGGAFDIASGGLAELWRSAEKRGRIPSQKEIEVALEGAGASNVIVSRGISTVFLGHEATQLDFGGIAKGYAIDRAISVLKARGAQKALINAGGQVYVLDDESSAEIGVQHPLLPDELVASVRLQNQSVATSANSERFFEIGEARYGHLIDPRTGRPAENEILSVSVISSSAKLADVFSTAAFVLGLEDGMCLVQARDDLEAVVVTREESGLRLSSSLSAPKQDKVRLRS